MRKKDHSTIWMNKIVYEYYYIEDNVVSIKRENHDKTSTIVAKPSEIIMGFTIPEILGTYNFRFGYFRTTCTVVPTL
jgi:hypothetical protein